MRSAIARNADIEFVGINDLIPPETIAHLFKYDSNFGVFPGTVELTDAGLVVNGKTIKLTAEPDPAKLPWGEIGADVVIESTGRFTDGNDAKKHIAAGAKKVVISAPAKNVDGTFVLGVNFDTYDASKHNIISNASCTTNCLAPVAKVLQDTVGIKHGLMTTIHAYTADQRLQDMPHKDLRRARAAALSLIPATTGAAKAVSLVIPALEGKLTGFAVRAPVPTGSVVDLTIEAERATSVEEINGAMKAASESGSLAGYLEYCTDPIVSHDIIGNEKSSIFDSLLTLVIDGTMVKVVSWYDNEWGYSSRVVDLAQKLF
jgi:glyceraldehyde 3-phosphate dehydrogenase